MSTSALPQRFEKVVGDHRIVNGSDAPLGKYPSMVTLKRNRHQICGGTILNENWVLTSASCING
jgi:secreted trypsin-like serine protease